MRLVGHENILVVIHSCLKYEQTRAVPLQKSWASGRNVLFIFDGDSKQIQNSINLGPYTQGVTYNPNTVYKIWQLFILNWSHYDYLFLVDDDSYVFMDKLESFLRFFDSTQNILIADFLNWPKFSPTSIGDYSAWPGGGSGMVFSQSAVKSLMSYAENIPLPPMNHDVYIHQLIRLDGSHTISRVHCPGFHQYGCDKLYKDTNLYDKLIAVHLNGRMELLENYHRIALQDKGNGKV